MVASIVEIKIFRNAGFNDEAKDKHIKAALQQFKEEYVAGNYKVDEAQFLATLNFFCKKEYGKPLNAYMNIIGFDSELLGALRQQHYADIIGMQIAPPTPGDKKCVRKGTVADTLYLADALAKGRPAGLSVFMGGLHKAIAAQVAELATVIDRDETYKKRFTALSHTLSGNLLALTKAFKPEQIADAVLAGTIRVLEDGDYHGFVHTVGWLKANTALDERFKAGLLERIAREQADMAANGMRDPHHHGLLVKFAVITKDMEAFGPVVGPHLKIAASQRADLGGPNDQKVLHILHDTVDGHVEWTSLVAEGVQIGEERRQARAASAPYSRMEGREQAVRKRKAGLPHMSFGNGS